MVRGAREWSGREGGRGGGIEGWRNRVQQLSMEERREEEQDERKLGGRKEGRGGEEGRRGGEGRKEEERLGRNAQS